MRDHLIRIVNFDIFISTRGPKRQHRKVLHVVPVSVSIPVLAVMTCIYARITDDDDDDLRHR